MRRWLVVLCLWFTAAAPTPRLSILSAPSVVHDGRADILIRVPYDATNERLIVALFAGADWPVRSSEQPTTEATLYRFPWYGLEPCDCTLLAVLYDRRAEVERESRALLIR